MPAPTPPQLLGSLVPSHLREAPVSTAALKNEVQTAVAPPAEPDPRSEKIYTFPFEYKDPSGRAYKGSFTNHILTIKERQAVKVLKARLGGGLQAGVLSEDDDALNEATAHLSYSLDDAPAWAKDLRELHDPQVVFEIYMKVLSHENYFFRGKSLEGAATGSNEAR